jgi:hypothetical protein
MPAELRITVLSMMPIAMIPVMIAVVIAVVIAIAYSMAVTVPLYDGKRRRETETQ